jgi:peptidoglycan hydrolase-like protein with peptidoglycan-binding domain
MYKRIMAGLATGTVAAAGLLAIEPRGGASAASSVTQAPLAPITTTTTRPDQRLVTLQRRLAALGYDAGPADGKLGPRTRHAVMAFQKVHGLTRTGRPGPEVDTALADATKPRAVVPDGAATRIEVDLRRQVLLYWRHGALARVLPVSTGSGKTYCVNGRCERAVTPTGRFRIERKVPGVDPGPLGQLYSPMYFHRGVAIHGYPAVPAYPASHGCVRIPMYATAALFQQLPIGTPVYVVAG